MTPLPQMPSVLLRDEADEPANGAPVRKKVQLAVARAGLPHLRRHSSNYPEYIGGHVSEYAGSAFCDASRLSIADRGVISAARVGGVEFAGEVIKRSLYDEQDTETSYQLFKHAVPPP